MIADVDNELKHILQLLDDESPEIQRILRHNFLKRSLDLIFKKPAYLMNVSARLRENLDHLFQNLHFPLVENAFQKLIEGNLEDLDLEKAVLLLSYWNNPEVELPAIQFKLDQLAQEIEKDFPSNEEPVEQIQRINFLLFEKHRFRGNTVDYYNPDNSFIDRVLETKKGIPITLSVLYLLVARRLQLSVTGIPMPAHFILKYDTGNREIFFDPFYGGRIYSRTECLNYLSNTQVTNPLEILQGCTHYQIVIRMMRNIHLVYSSYREEEEKVREIETLISRIEQYYS